MVGGPVPLLQWGRSRGSLLVLRARRAVLRGGVLLCVTLLLLWASIFLYGTFYYSYMPAVTFVRPVHYAFRCVWGRGMCGAEVGGAPLLFFLTCVPPHFIFFF